MTNTSSIPEPEGMTNKCESCGQVVFGELDPQGVCKACVRAATAAAANGDGEDMDPIEAMLNIVTACQENVTKLTAKVDRLDERLSQLVAIEPVGKQLAEKFAKNHAHLVEVKLEKGLANADGARGKLLTMIDDLGSSLANAKTSRSAVDAIVRERMTSVRAQLESAVGDLAERLGATTTEIGDRINDLAGIVDQLVDAHNERRPRDGIVKNMIKKSLRSWLAE